jgi:hypothetical protein
MIVKEIVENANGTMTIVCDFTPAEVRACVEVGFLKLLKDYLDEHAPFHEGNTDEGKDSTGSRSGGTPDSE